MRSTTLRLCPARRRRRQQGGRPRLRRAADAAGGRRRRGSTPSASPAAAATTRRWRGTSSRPPRRGERDDLGDLALREAPGDAVSRQQRRQQAMLVWTLCRGPCGPESQMLRVLCCYYRLRTPAATLKAGRAQTGFTFGRVFVSKAPESSDLVSPAVERPPFKLEQVNSVRGCACRADRRARPALKRRTNALRPSLCHPGELFA